MKSNSISFKKQVLVNETKSSVGCEVFQIAPKILTFFNNNIESKVLSHCAKICQNTLCNEKINKQVVPCDIQPNPSSPCVRWTVFLEKHSFFVTRNVMSNLHDMNFQTSALCCFLVGDQLEQTSCDNRSYKVPFSIRTYKERSPQFKRIIFSTIKKLSGECSKRWNCIEVSNFFKL